MNHLCTLVARDQDEDPIGSANPFRQCLALELPLPWAPEVTRSRGFPKGVLDAVQEARKDGEIPLLGIAPDPQYTTPGFTRVLRFCRPAPPFAVFEKEEYLVPSDDLVPLVEALFLRSENLPAFSPYKAETSDLSDLLVCTHGTHDQCCGKFGYPLYAALRKLCEEQHAPVRVWRTSHFSGHRFSPTLIDFPQGRFWGNLTSQEDIARLITRSGPLPDLDRCYRGWAGASYLMQFAERELFRREGWDWTRQRVSGRVTDAWTDTGHYRPAQPPWARIDGDLVRRARVEFEVAGDPHRTHEAIVEFARMVPTLYDCVKRGKRENSPQFRVTKLT